MYSVRLKCCSVNNTSGSQPNYFLAVDAGATKADFLLADDSAELARVRGGSIKVLNTSPEAAEANFIQAARQLEQISGVPLAKVTRTCIGTAGFSAPSVIAWLRQQHASRIGGELILCGDEEIALDAAFRGGRGVLALAGTGNNVVGRTADGRLATAGGWGPVLGDEGSGHWIGLQAVRAIFRTIDEGRATTLESAVLQAWKLESLKHLIERGNSTDLRDFATLTPLVVDCAMKGDAVASEVLRRGGQELGRLVALVIRRMEDMEGSSFVAPSVAIAGSILEKVPTVRDAMSDALQRSWPEIIVHSQAVDPALGALWRARRPNP
jgi:N-acetylglucosamine kinase-like BadF-type ATPase